MDLNFYTNVQMVGNQFLVRGYRNGKSFISRDGFFPTLFVSSKKQTKYKTLQGEYVESIKPGSVKDCREFIKTYAGVENFKIYGNEKYIYQYISDNYSEDEIKFDISKIRLTTIDIEVASENGFPDVENAAEEILLITLQDYNTKKIRTWGLGPYENNNSEVTYREFSDEHSLLTDFINWWMIEENTPEIITGWNSELYDIAYLVRRMETVIGEKLMRRLSPWGLVTQDDIYDKGRKYIAYDIGGISQLDYLKLYKWSPATSNQESYRLDHIAEVELGQKKLDHSEFDTFKDFYTKGWQKFVRYNIKDVELVDRLEDKMKLIELALTMAYDAKVNYKDVFSQVRMWDTIIYNHLKKKNIVIPPKQKVEKNDKYAGAYVKEPVPGVYSWVVSFDLTSLYPSLIMQYNISPETLLDEIYPEVSVDKLLKKEVVIKNITGKCVSANGCMYDTTKKGIFPELVDNIFNDRQIYKKKMLDAKKEYEKNPSKQLEKEISRYNNIQMARKIQINSLYGAIGNEWFRYYKLANAEAITLSGQVAIRWIENKMKKYLNKLLKTDGIDYVIASDTDSIYLNMGPLVDIIFKEKEKNPNSIVSFLDKICKGQIEDYINKSYQELAEYMNVYAQKMQMKRENIADRGIWTAKKRYILNVWDSEGVRYEEPKLKIMGIEAVKSSTPAPCRKMIKDGLKIMMSGTENEVIQFIEDCREKFYLLSPEQIAFPRTASDIRKYSSESNIYSSKTPIHVRGSLLFNYYIQKKNLTNKYSLIGNGEKVKYIFLKIPNIIQENVISFISEFPKELGLEKYIDYELQFQKSFLDPLKSILDAIGWASEDKVTLDYFFN